MRLTQGLGLSQAVPVGTVVKFEGELLGGLGVQGILGGLRILGLGVGLVAYDILVRGG